MVRLARRWMLLATCAVALGSLFGCGGSAVDERFLRGLQPVAADVGPVVRLRAFPARVRSAGNGQAVLRASAPSLNLEIEADAPAEISLTIANLPASARLTPAPAWERRPRADTLEVGLSLPAGLSRFSIGSEAAGPSRIAVVSDLHDNAESLALILADMKARSPAFIACMGDTSDQGTAEELDRMLDQIEASELPFYSTLGNHDAFGDAADRFEARVGPATFAFDWAGARFVLIDSSDASVPPSSWPWLEQQLANRSGPGLVFTHVPPLDSSGMRNHAFRIRDEGLRLVDVLARTHTDALFVGHVHDFAEYELGGVPVFLTGGGGKVKPWAAGVGHHYLEVEIRPGDAEPLSVARRDVD